MDARDGPGRVRPKCAASSEPRLETSRGIEFQRRPCMKPFGRQWIETWHLAEDLDVAVLLDGRAIVRIRGADHDDAGHFDRWLRSASSVRSVWLIVPSAARATTRTPNPARRITSTISSVVVTGTSTPPAPSTIQQRPV